jgi:hypothetical protein
MSRKLFLSAAVVCAVAFLSTAVASARTPTTTTMPGDYSVTFAGNDSPCHFDITFTGTGTVTVTTYYDNTGNPVRESVHGTLTHTVSSAWHTLTSNGPAPVHIDLTTGLTTDTGKEFAFHIPGSGVVWAQNGRFVFGQVGTISYSGLNTLDTTALCSALAP